MVQGRRQRVGTSYNAAMTLAWAAGALVIFLASFVMGLTGFGIALVAMAFLPWLMSPVTAIVLLTL
jgi:Flp pilus assembly protein TadB